jgi:hypothetical protein
VPLLQSYFGVPESLTKSGLKLRTPLFGGVLSNSALVRILAGLLGGLLRLLPRLFARLLTLLARLVLIAMLRLALAVLIHSILQRFAEILFECTSLKQRPYVGMNCQKYRGGRSLFQNKVRLQFIRRNNAVAEPSTASDLHNWS